ncbi:hypothetical protein HPB52_005650 [Rhipicephalus sanguineus]|uniref:non-specific serine/threonine protein kinase n=1 Tax=Rhipicephalus sanguineus TaxID=34632 RepID=A0A9D4STD7_RHISA|nr:hypothetical protein HPB52_005650 [Rhipicephalus sanguineus]
MHRPRRKKSTHPSGRPLRSSRPSSHAGFAVALRFHPRRPVDDLILLASRLVRLAPGVLRTLVLVPHCFLSARAEYMRRRLHSVPKRCLFFSACQPLRRHKIVEGIPPLAIGKVGFFFRYKDPQFIQAWTARLVMLCARAAPSEMDVYLCGRFNITTGKYPFEGDNIYRLFECIGRGKFELPPDVEPTLGDLLCGMLHKDPQVRLSLQLVRRHDWVRRKPPRLLEYVSVPDRSNGSNPLRSMTVIPYLPLLHGRTLGAEGGAGSQGEEDDDDSQEYYTEHDLQELRQRTDESCGAGVPRRGFLSRSRVFSGCQPS